MKCNIRKWQLSDAKKDEDETFAFAITVDNRADGVI